MSFMISMLLMVPKGEKSCLTSPSCNKQDHPD